MFFGIGKEKRTQLFFRDDGKFQFRKLPIKDTVLQEKTGEVLQRAWKHFYQTQFPFVGYKGIPADMVTLGYSRDIILDPFGIIPPDEKPKPDSQMGNEDKLIKPWITQVAETQLYKIQSKPQKHVMVDIIIGTIGAAIVIEVIAILLQVAAK